MAKVLGVEVEKIYIYPLGGISKFFMDFNLSFKKEFLILITGPLCQLIGAFLLLSFLPHYSDIIKIYNFNILLFNLLPIYPLDGGKLVNLVLCNFLSFKRSYYLSFFIGYVIVFFIFLKNISTLKINLIFVVLFLMYKLTKEYKNINYYFEKFLLERYLNNYTFNDTKIIKNINNMYKNKNHLIKVRDNYYWEKDLLNKIYKKC